MTRFRSNDHQQPQRHRRGGHLHHVQVAVPPADGAVVAGDLPGLRMSRAQITLSSRADRDRAINWIAKAPAGTRVTFREAKRSDAQNSKLWACLTEVAVQVEWHGQKLTPDDWKLVFLSALKQEMRIVPNIDGNGFVNLGRSSSRLSKAEFGDLLEIIAMFGANHGVKFRDEQADEAGQAA